MTANPNKIIRWLKGLGDAEDAAFLQKFFKTGKGEYGYGDVFLGIRVPVIRNCAKELKDTSLPEILKVLKSPFHEARLLALIMLAAEYDRAEPDVQAAVYKAYLANTRYINNWDLVDCSAGYVVGRHLFDKNRDILYKLAKSENLWERRISIISTSYFIARKDFSDTLKIAGMLLHDREDLIHKAVGWMLREVGKRDLAAEEKFLRKHAGRMPRTMLRYAIERFPEPKRKRYLSIRLKPLI